jgi:hypothetical protein
MANVHGGNLHHPDTEAIKGRCIRTNFHHYILKCTKCSVNLATTFKQNSDYYLNNQYHCFPRNIDAFHDLYIVNYISQR